MKEPLRIEYPDGRILHVPPDRTSEILKISGEDNKARSLATVAILGLAATTIYLGVKQAMAPVVAETPVAQEPRVSEVDSRLSNLEYATCHLENVLKAAIGAGNLALESVDDCRDEWRTMVESDGPGLGSDADTRRGGQETTK